MQYRFNERRETLYGLVIKWPLAGGINRGTIAREMLAQWPDDRVAPYAAGAFLTLPATREPDGVKSTRRLSCRMYVARNVMKLDQMARERDGRP